MAAPRPMLLLLPSPGQKPNPVILPSLWRLGVMEMVRTHAHGGHQHDPLEARTAGAGSGAPHGRAERYEVRVLTAIAL